VTYANDLAFKSLIALGDGDRTTAYRLAEFAHRYVDEDNLQVTSALVEAIYCNDKPSRPPLPWVLNTLKDHSSWVMSVSLSPDGKYLATGSSDNKAKIWDLKTGKVALTLEGHSDGISSVAFSPDGKCLATGSSDNMAKIWDWKTGEVILALEGHSNGISSIAFSPDGKRIVNWVLRQHDQNLGLENGQIRKSHS
jgi:WD40 repeat protein